MTSISPEKKISHPKGLSYLCFVEIWERFGYYGVRFILVLFLTQHHLFLWSDNSASQFLGFLFMLLFSSSALSATIVNSYFGQRRSVIIGGFFQMLAYFCMAQLSPYPFLLGCSFMVLGTGIIKSSLTNLVGELYPKAGQKQDQGYGIFYAAINLGICFTGLITPYIAEKIGWCYAFYFMGFMMSISVLSFVMYGQYYITDPCDKWTSLATVKAVFTNKSAKIFWSIILFFISIFTWKKDFFIDFILNHNFILMQLIAFIVLGIVFFHLNNMLTVSQTKIEKDRMQLFCILILSVFIFFFCFEQAASSLNLYTERYIDCTIHSLNKKVAVGSIQMLSFFFSLILAYPCMVIWDKLSSRYNLNAFHQIAFGSFFLSCSFMLMFFLSFYRREGIKLSLFWMIPVYFFQGLSELMFYPTLLSIANFLPRQEISSKVMCIFFSLLGLSNHFIGLFFSYIEPLQSRFREKSFFGIDFCLSLVLGILLWLSNSYLCYKMHTNEE